MKATSLGLLLSETPPKAEHAHSQPNKAAGVVVQWSSFRCKTWRRTKSLSSYGIKAFWRYLGRYGNQIERLKQPWFLSGSASSFCTSSPWRQWLHWWVEPCLIGCHHWMAEEVISSSCLAIVNMWHLKYSERKVTSVTCCLNITNICLCFTCKVCFMHGLITESSSFIWPFIY